MKLTTMLGEMRQYPAVYGGTHGALALEAGVWSFRSDKYLLNGTGVKGGGYKYAWLLYTEAQYPNVEKLVEAHPHIKLL